MSTQRKLVVAVTVMALVGASAVGTAAGGNLRARSTVTIHGHKGDFHGLVTSKRKSCLSHRKVVVYKRKGEIQLVASDPIVGIDVIKRHGAHARWALRNTGFRHGDFYAYLRGTEDCKADRTKTISI